MKHSTADAARELDIHPANLVLALSAECESLNEVWPTIDLVAIDLFRLLQAEKTEKAPPQSQFRPAEDHATWSDRMVRVLRLLDKHKHWGRRRAVRWRTLHRKYYQDGVGLKAVVDKLIEREVVGTTDTRFTSIYWLVEERKAEIRNLIKVDHSASETIQHPESDCATRLREVEAAKAVLRQELVESKGHTQGGHGLLPCDRCKQSVHPVRSKRGSYLILWHCPNCGTKLDEEEYGPAGR